MKADAPFASLTWLRFALIVLALLAGLASLGEERHDLDACVSTYMGGAILKGELLYRDVWDIRAPGIFFLYAGIILLLGKSVVALRAFDLAWQCVTALVLARLSRRIFPGSRWNWIPGALYLIVYFGLNTWSWAEPEGFLILPLLLSALCVLRAEKSDRLLDWFLAALALGIACLLKLPFGLLGIAYLVIAARPRLQRPNGGPAALARVAMRYAALAAGITVPLLGCVLLFAAQGTLRDLYESQFIAAPAYLAYVRSDTSFWVFLKRLRQTLLLPWLALAAGLPLLLHRRREIKRDTPGSGVLLLLAWLGVAMLIPLLQRETTMYRFLPLLPPLLVLGTYVIFRPVLEPAGKRSYLLMAIAAITTLTFAAPLANAAMHARVTLGMARREGDLALLKEAAAALQQNTRPTDKVLVWGNEPTVYLLAERRAACPVLSTSLVHVPGFGQRLQQECMRRLHAAPPVYIVEFVVSSQFGGLRSGRQSFEEFRELYEFTMADYEVERANWKYVLYRRRANVSAPAR